MRPSPALTATLAIGLFACAKEGGFAIHPDAAPVVEDGAALGDGGEDDGGPDEDAAEPIDYGPLPDSGFALGTMSFFVTSSGNANGGNYGGIAGMDAKCQALAAAVGFGSRTWRVYASTSTPAMDARDRIGFGPWYNQAGLLVANTVEMLHDTPPVAALLIDEKGAAVPATARDILTGSDMEGRDSGQNCNNWLDGTDTTQHMVGRTDWSAIADGDPERSWNSAHDSGCALATMRMAGGEGRLYCFALN